MFFSTIKTAAADYYLDPVRGNEELIESWTSGFRLTYDMV